MPKLNEEVKTVLEVPISVLEIKRAIDDLNTGKSPGPDGLGAAFYEPFKEPMAEALHRVLLEAYEVKEMPPSFRRKMVALVEMPPF